MESNVGTTKARHWSLRRKMRKLPPIKREEMRRDDATWKKISWWKTEKLCNAETTITA